MVDGWTGATGLAITGTIEGQSRPKAEIPRREEIQKMNKILIAVGGKSQGFAPRMLADTFDVTEAFTSSAVIHAIRQDGIDVMLVRDDILSGAIPMLPSATAGAMRAIPVIVVHTGRADIPRHIGGVKVVKTMVKPMGLKEVWHAVQDALRPPGKPSALAPVMPAAAVV
jgi:hypothetical protein